MLLFIDLTAEVDRMSSEGRVDLGVVQNDDIKTKKQKGAKKIIKLNNKKLVRAKSSCVSVQGKKFRPTCCCSNVGYG